MIAEKLAWMRGYIQREEGDVPGTQTALYRLTDLINAGLIPTSIGRPFLFDAGLLDMVFALIWADDHATTNEELEAKFEECEGFVVFMHGWTGNHAIWESIPGMTVVSNKKLIAITVDHNGFGASLLVDETPPLDKCNPPAAMNTIENLIDVLQLRRQPGQRSPKVINFVGHSMGGAALFYLNPLRWRMGEETRLALAPALLLDDDTKRIFFTAVGLGIGIVNRLHIFEVFERFLKPQVIEAVCSGASYYVKELHRYQYQHTPRGITASTFLAMGLLNNREIPRQFDFFKTMLGHRDTLVGLVPMMDLLSRLEFPASNVRVVAGSHYMFSVGPDAVFQHAQNRELVVQDVLTLHAAAYLRQRIGVRIG
ncbi:MAG: alpha/beta hydrolase [Anaerolinea sp.]|nr:alpha/beta hydrolase [Anaerolinea sp.]